MYSVQYQCFGLLHVAPFQCNLGEPSQVSMHRWGKGSPSIVVPVVPVVVCVDKSCKAYEIIHTVQVFPVVPSSCFPPFIWLFRSAWRCYVLSATRSISPPLNWIKSQRMLQTADPRVNKFVGWVQAVQGPHTPQMLQLDVDWLLSNSRRVPSKGFCLFVFTYWWSAFNKAESHLT